MLSLVYYLFTKLPWPGDSAMTNDHIVFESLAPSLHYTKDEISTLSLDAARQAGKL